MMRQAWFKIRKSKLFSEDGERGAVLIITAILLVVLIGFAALTVDLGALFVERRQAQSAADVAALSGAQFAEDGMQAVVDEVIDLTTTNLGLAPSAWDKGACVDGEKYAFGTATTDCVSFTFALAKIRVRIPDQTFNTFFAGVLGFDTLTTSAFAEVTGDVSKSGDILPFGVPQEDASATLGCPSDHPNGLYPCDGPDSGNFNHLNITQWGIDPPPVHDCTYSNGSFEDNLAKGIDHPLAKIDGIPVHDQDACNDPALANIADPPDIIQSKTGVAQSLLMPGLITGSAGGSPGRLTEIHFGSTVSTDSRTIMGKNLDNEPLWNFIGSGASGVPAFCVRSTFNNATNAPFDWDEDLWVVLGGDPIAGPEDDPDYDGVDPDSLLEEAASFEHMARCLREYRFGEWDIAAFDPLTWDPITNPDNGYPGSSFGGLLFTASGAVGTNPDRGIYNLQLSSRWGWSPIGGFSTGTNPFPIIDFKPIYIQTLVAECNNNSCGWVWHAGQTPPFGDPGGNKIQSVVSFQLPTSSLPAAVTTFAPGSESKVPYSLTK